MKKLIFGFLFLSMSSLLFLACEKEDATESSDDSMIEMIADSENKMALTINEIPSNIVEFTTSAYPDNYIDEAYTAESLGYEIWLDSQEDLYFNTRGNFLGKGKGKRGHKGGPKGGSKDGNKRKCMKGDSIGVSDLPQGIIDSIASRLPDATIEAAVVKSNGWYAVKLDNGMALIFTAEGKFVTRCGDKGWGPPHPPKAPCLKGDTVTVDDLPPGVVDSIANRFPDETIDLVVENEDGNFAVQVSNGLVLVFTADGEFKGKCGVKDRPKHHPKKRHCFRGQEADISGLPDGIGLYVSEEYAGETIEKAVTKPDGGFAVKLSDGTVLLFDAEGNFVKKCGE